MNSSLTCRWKKCHSIAQQKRRKRKNKKRRQSKDSQKEYKKRILSLYWYQRVFASFKGCLSLYFSVNVSVFAFLFFVVHEVFMKRVSLSLNCCRFSFLPDSKFSSLSFCVLPFIPWALLLLLWFLYYYILWDSFLSLPFDSFQFVLPFQSSFLLFLVFFVLVALDFGGETKRLLSLSLQS